MNRSGKLYALLSTCRVANIPSVVCNVLLGVAVGSLRSESFQKIECVWVSSWIILSVSGVLLYVSGNFFNDWMDHAWDAKNRPERALPSGVFPPSLYAGLAIVCGAGGVCLAGLTSSASGLVAAGIAVCIVIYTIFHKRTAWAVIPMGLCRALLPVMGCFALFPYIDYVWPVACALLCYIMGLSLSARYESMSEPPRWVAISGRALLLGAVVLVAWGNRKLLLDRGASLVGVFPYLIWTSLSLRIWRKPVPLLVSRLLAGIPLVDWMVLLPLSVGIYLDGNHDMQGFMIVSAVAPPLAFIIALALQRLAPAT